MSVGLSVIINFSQSRCAKNQPLDAATNDETITGWLAAGYEPRNETPPVRTAPGDDSKGSPVSPSRTSKSCPSMRFFHKSFACCFGHAHAPVLLFLLQQRVSLHARASPHGNHAPASREPFFCKQRANCCTLNRQRDRFAMAVQGGKHGTGERRRYRIRPLYPDT